MHIDCAKMMNWDCKKKSGKAYGGAGYVLRIGVGVNRLLLFKSSTV